MKKRHVKHQDDSAYGCYILQYSLLKKTSVARRPLN